MKALSNESAVVVFSGGQDSTTCLYWALGRFATVRSITFDYGQMHRRELTAAAAIAERAGVSHVVVGCPVFDEIVRSSLIERTAHLTSDRGDALPDSFVPGRNIVFLTLAAAYSYTIGAAHIVAGVCQTDYSGYPDCRESTMVSLEETLRRGMDAQFTLHTPLMHLSKAESVRLATEVGALEALAYSHTCYAGRFPPCGSCAACELRAKGFAEAGVEDPLLRRAREGG